MKKTMKTMLAFVAGALCLAGCAKEEINVTSSPKLVTLAAYQEGDVKAAIDATDSKKIDWTSGDKINYFGAATGESMTLNTGAGTTAGTFKGEVTQGASDCVLYPYQSTATNNAGVITAEVPMTQYAVAGSFDPAAALMVGVVNNGTSVQFQNVMSYVKVTILADMKNCKQVVLKAKDAWTTVAGKVNINASTGEWSETTAKEGQAFVRLVPQAGDTYLTPGASYYIAILPQAMATGFELIFNDNDVIKVKQSASSPVEFGRSKTKVLGAVGSFNYTVDTFNLTPVSGTSLKIANRNIGAAAMEDNGDFFARGALRPAYTKKPASGTTLTDLYWSKGFTASSVPSTFTDIAAMLWGGNWRMPTGEEWSANKDNVYVQIMPKAGYCNAKEYSANSTGYYWSSSLNGDNTIFFYIDASSKYVQSGYDRRARGYSVRPVLAQ